MGLLVLPLMHWVTDKESQLLHGELHQRLKSFETCFSHQDEGYGIYLSKYSMTVK